MYYHSCIIHLFRPFLKVSFIQGDKTPRQICTENANAISHLMDQYIGTYDTNWTVFIQSHCVMTAGIIHLVDISSTPTPTAASTMDQSEIFLAASIRQLHSISLMYPLVSRYYQAMVGLVHKWCTVIPTRVQNAISDTNSKSAPANTMLVGSTDLSPIPITKSTTNGFIKPPATDSNTSHPYFAENNHSKPELMRKASLQQPHMQTYPLHQQCVQNPASFRRPFQRAHGFDQPRNSDPPTSVINSTNVSSYQQQLFWTPFPDSSDGVPLPMPSASSSNFGSAHGMSVTNMLGGEFPQLSQDGFMLVGGNFGSLSDPAPSLLQGNFLH